MESILKYHYYENGLWLVPSPLRGEEGKPELLLPGIEKIGSSD